MAKNYRNGYWHSDCSGCEGHNVPYMIQFDLWNQVAQPGDVFLCLSCVESRLDRELTLEDFIEENTAGIPLPINNGHFGFDAKEWIETRQLNRPPKED